MKRSQVSTHISRWKGKGAMYIVAHARFQKKRGKNPSEPYKGELNPRKALFRALTELRTYEPMCGDSIPASIGLMVEIAKFTNQEVTGIFNEVSVTATPRTSKEVLTFCWRQEIKRGAVVYQKSAEFRSCLLERAKKVQAMREKVHSLMRQLETLDFENLEVVVNWFEELQEASDDIRVMDLIPHGEVVDKFVAHGYQINVNTYEEFIADDRDNFGRYLVGRALDSLAWHRGIHPIYKHFAKDWRQKFSALPA